MPYRQNFPIPAVIDPPKQCLCIQIPNHPDWKAVIAGNLSELQNWFNWERTGDTSGAECAAVWKEVMLSIDWSDMSCCCGGQFGIIFRWTVDGVLESSSDGGTTWTEDPTQDPRNSSPTYPPVPGEPSEDKLCIAATSITLLLREQVGDQLTDDMSRYTLGQLIHDWVTTYLQTSNPFEALIQIITNQVLALVISAVRAALTDGVYETLTCIFRDNMEDDLSFTDVGWGQVRSDILSQITGVAGIFFEHLVYLLGKIGITNLARSQAATEGDCSSCDECVCNLEAMVAFGTFLECIGDTVYVEAALDGSTYAVYMNYGGVEGGTYDVNVCRDVSSYNVYEGTVGSSSTNRTVCHTGETVFGAYLSSCGAQHGWVSGAPFKVSIQYATCDDCG